MIGKAQSIVSLSITSGGAASARNARDVPQSSSLKVAATGGNLKTFS